MISFAARCTASPNMMFLNIDNEAVLLNTESELYFGLDDVGTMFWEELTNASTVQSALENLLAKFEGVDEPALRQDLEAFITNMQGRGLLLVVD